MPRRRRRGERDRPSATRRSTRDADGRRRRRSADSTPSTPIAEDSADMGGGARADLASWGSATAAAASTTTIAASRRRSPTQVTLRDHLIEQLNVDIADPVDRLIGCISSTARRGRLSRGELAAVAAAAGLRRWRASRRRWRGCSASIRPASSRATLPNAWRCSSRDRDRLDPAMARCSTISICWRARDFASLLRHLRRRRRGSRRHDRRDQGAQSQAGLAFDHDVAQPVVPDVSCAPQPDGGWHVELNADTLPRVLVNTRYYAK